jgi:formylglycine-generating enzyme required for sulfatase activity
LGEKAWENYKILQWGLGLIWIACLAFAFLQLRRLARVRHQRRWDLLKWFSGRLLRERGGEVEQASTTPPVSSLRARDQVSDDVSDPEMRSRLKDEAEHWQAAARRDAAITGAVAALPVIVGLIFAAIMWWGVRQVEAEMKFVPISLGCLEMGSPDGEAGRRPDEGPVHKVCVKAFDLGQYEVTQGEWRQVTIYPKNPSYFKGNDSRPVEKVSWNDVQRFLRVMSLFGRRQYRLPSEAEWEFAARAGTTTSRYWGDGIDDGCAYENITDLSLKKAEPDYVVANCDDGYARTAPVGSFSPNSWDLYDMLGNVRQWVEDCYVDNYRDTPIDGSPNTKEPCTDRVLRGGSWEHFPPGRAAGRYHAPPNWWSYDVGFRVVRAATP